MLIEAIRHINNDKLTFGKIYGQEKNLSTSAIARMNLFLHGAKDFKVVQGDTLRLPQFQEAGKVQTFDCVIANPPFGLDGWGADRFINDPYGRNIWGCPSDNSADCAWLQHMVASMKKGTGKCAMILPQGVLFHNGKEGEIREQLIKSDLIECVITLVGGIFYSTGVSACVLLLNRHKESSHVNKICMIDATGIYTEKRAQNYMSIEDITEVYTMYERYEDVIEKCKIVDLNEITDTLMPKAYVDRKEADTINVEAVFNSYDKLYRSMLEKETIMLKMLKEGGYINE